MLLRKTLFTRIKLSLFCGKSRLRRAIDEFLVLYSTSLCLSSDLLLNSSIVDFSCSNGSRAAAHQSIFLFLFFVLAQQRCLASVYQVEIKKSHIHHARDIWPNLSYKTLYRPKEAPCDIWQHETHLCTEIDQFFSYQNCCW
jgi:hypothetical protein